MHRQTTTTILLTLTLLCFHTKAFPLFEGNSFRNNFVMNAHASSSGRVQLKKDSSDGFYVDADFASSEVSKTSPNAAIFDAVKMLISIANEETLVASSCLSFSPYDCNRYSCSTYDVPTDINFPTFTVSGATQVKSYINLDYQNWKIDDSYFYIADSCKTGDINNGLGKDRSGVLGLGTSPLSKSFYLQAPLFSILINSNLTGGELLFMKEGKYTQSNPLYTFKGNSTWQFPTDSAAYIKLSSSATSSVSLANLNVMFDVNSDAIGLPEELYKTFLSKVLALPNFNCGSDYYKPLCYTKGKFEDLPDIILSLNKTQIIIPYKIYATFYKNYEDKAFYFFNFKATGSSLAGNGYVSPAFKNSIILDANFMSYYYTVFDGRTSDNVIQIYSTAISDSEPNFVKWIIFIAIGVILLAGGFGICYWLKQRGETSNKNYAPTMPITTDGFDTAQAPLVHNQQEINDIAPSDAENAFTLNGPAQSQIQIYPEIQDLGYVPPVENEEVKEKAKL